MTSALTDAGRLFWASFEHANIPMVVGDSHGRILLANEAMARFLRYPSEQLQLMSFADVTDPADRADQAEVIRRLGNGEAISVSRERGYLRGDGERAWGRSTAIAVRDDQGDLIRMVVQVEDVAGRRADRDALIHRESHDLLTDLANSGLFHDRVHDALTDRRAAIRRVAVFEIGVDRFRQLTDGLGDASGDEVLVEVACRLLSSTRGQDTVARLTSDSFAVLATDVTTPADAVVLAGKLRDVLADPFWVGGNAIHIATSVGIACASGDGRDARTVIRRAGVALTRAQSLRCGWALYVEGEEEVQRQQLSLVEDLRTALDTGQITVAYQPIVNFDETIDRVEALARWRHPERGLVPPDQFIALAEQADLIAPLTEHVLGSAVAAAAQWAADGLAVGVAVNLSGMMFGEPDLGGLIGRALDAAGLPARCLTVEITESALIEGDRHQIWAVLADLQTRGVRVSIDDFGTGYSSLAYLKQLPVDELKIDRSFVQDLQTDERSERIVRSIIDLAHSLGLTVVAEGVESAATAARLRAVGCDHLQGFGIARPAPAAVTRTWLLNHTAPGLASPDIPPGREGLDVLIVDDDPIVRSALRAQLTARGHRVVAASDGHAAVELVTASRPDMVVLDHLMPGLTGVETVPLLRNAGFDGPIVLYTGALPVVLATMRFPLDVWPVSKSDNATLMTVIDGYAARPRQPA